MNRPLPQTFERGSYWPDWAPKDFLEHSIQRYAAKHAIQVVEVKGGSSSASLITFICPWKKDDKVHPVQRCSFLVRIKVDRTAVEHEATMAEVCLEHCHKITNDPEKRRARRGEAERRAQAAADRILFNARQESRRMKRREGNRTGFEAEDADLNLLLPQEQLSMVDDVRRELGESEARKLVYELGREGLLVAGFPRPAIYEPPAASRSPSPLSEISATDSPCSMRSDSSDSGEEDEEEKADEDAAIPVASTSTAVQPTSGGEQSRQRFPVRSRAPSPSYLPKKRPRSSSPAGSDTPSNLFERSSVARTTAETESSVKKEDKPQHPSPIRQPAASPPHPTPSTSTATALHSLNITTPAQAVVLSSPSPRPSSPLPSPSPCKRRRETIQDFLPPPHADLETSPFATSSSFLTDVLQPFLVSLFPSSPTDSLTLTANTLVRAGITTLSDLATVMLLDRRALKELVIAHELRRQKEGEEAARKSPKRKGKEREEDPGDGDVEAECLRLAEFFQRAREVWRDTMGRLGEGGGEGS